MKEQGFCSFLYNGKHCFPLYKIGMCRGVFPSYEPIYHKRDKGKIMRIDKYLKNSRLIKRRTVAKEACEQERILINDKVAKPGSEVNVGDVIWIRFGNSELKVKVKAVLEHVTKETAAEMYEII